VASTDEYEALLAALPPMQALFVREYLVDLNGTHAHKRAGYKAKNDASAAAQASALLRKPNVSCAVAAGRAVRAEQLELDAYWVLKRLRDISDRAMKEEPVLDMKGKPTGEWKFDSGGANKAAELIGKHLGMFKDKVEHTGKDGGPIVVDHLSEITSILARRPKPTDG
jgi:phage terminase small subunit